jgi:FkbM family methyltransferase
LKKIIPGEGDPDYPLSFRLARTLHTLFYGLSHTGQYFLYSLLGKLGSLDRAGRFPHFDGHIFVPLRVSETLYVNDYTHFYSLREVNYAHELNSLFDEFVFLDCGGYFGQISMRMIELCPRLSEVILFEPSPESCVYAQANLQMTGKPYKIINAAVSDFSGNATLEFPEGKGVQDSAYIEPNDDGDIRVVRLDDLLAAGDLDVAGKNLAMKIDVEGQELAAVSGAREVIRGAKGVCYFLELHPEVLQRMGQTAESLLQAVSAVRPTDWYMADRPYLKLDITKPVFEQIGYEKVRDVIGVAS